MIKNQFEEYLIKKGYSVKTPSGNPSTVYDYIKRIDRVCLNENMSWNELANQISMVITQYDIGGSKEELGRKSHNAVINALKRFGEFVAEKSLQEE